MFRTYRRNAVAPIARWAGLVVVLLLLISPAHVFAAPAQQLDLTLVGTWQSVPSTTGETVTISLFDDGSLQGTSTYADNDDVILYGGTWETTGEDAFTLHVESVNGEPGESVIDFPGLVTRRGLRLPDAPDWGRNGMTLLLLSEEPTDFASGATGDDIAVATEEPLEDPTEEPTAESMAEPTAEPTEEITAEPTAEPVAVETPVVVAVDDEGGYAGVYTSGELVDEDAGITRVINIALYDNGSMETYSSYEDPTTTDASLELGYWEDAGDGTLTITFESIDGEEYDPAVPISFEILDDGAQLLAAAVTAYSEGGLLVTRTDDELPSVVSETEDEGEDTSGEPVVSVADGFTIAGLYTTGPVDVGGGMVAGVFVYLGEDGFAQSAVVVMDGESTPVARVGEWVENEDGSVSVTLTGELIFDDSSTATTADLDEPEVLNFTVDGSTLVNPEVVLYPAGETVQIGDSAGTFEEENDAPEEIATPTPVEESTETTESTDAFENADSIIFISPIDTIIAGTTVSLVLLEDGHASIAVSSNALDTTVVETGTWEGDEAAGLLSVTFEQDGFGQPLAEPVTIEFTYDEATDTLTAGEYDAEHYGPDLTLEMVEQ